MLRSLLIASALVAAAARAEVVLLEDETVTLGDTPRGMTLADVNGDGRADLLAVAAGVDSLVVLLNLGPNDEERFNFGDRRVTRAGDNPHGLAIGDFNGDDILDAAVSNHDDDTVMVFTGDGAGGFALLDTLGVRDEPEALVAADFNGDGRDDLAVLETGDDALAMILADDGGFAGRAGLTAPEHATTLVAADIDGDGDQDLVAAGDDTDIRLNDGSGDLDIAQTLDFDARVTGGALGDVDEDGLPDFIVLLDDATALRVLYNDGSGTPYSDDEPEDTAWVDEVALSAEPTHLHIADVSSDGHLDLLVIGGEGAGFLVIEGTGYGKFTARESVSSEGAVQALDSADIDGDGRVDVAGLATGVDGARLFRGLNSLPYDAFETFALGVTPAQAYPATLDADGAGDLIVRDSSQALLYLLRSDGESAFVLSGTLALPAPAAAVRVADLDANGLDDVLVQPGGASAVEVHAATGPSTFALEETVDIGARIGAFALGEFDGNPGRDLVIADIENDELHVYASDGAWSYTPMYAHSLGERPALLETIDLDGDGIDEIAVTFGTPSSTFVVFDVSPVTLVERAVRNANFDASRLRVADVDGDGDADLAAVAEAVSRLHVLINNGGELANAFEDYETESGPVDALIDDVDEDGDPDAVIVAAYAKRIGVLYRDGAAYQTHGNYLDTGASPSSGALVDINGDGRNEVVVTLPGNGEIGIAERSENEAPDAADLTFELDEDEDTVEDFLEGSDANGDDLEYVIEDAPQYGTLELLNAADGYFRYVAGDDFDGNDSFTYRVSDGALVSEVAVVSITRDDEDDGGGAMFAALLLLGACARRRTKPAA